MEFSDHRWCTVLRFLCYTVGTSLNTGLDYIFFMPILVMSAGSSKDLHFGDVVESCVIVGQCITTCSVFYYCGHDSYHGIYRGDCDSCVIDDHCVMAHAHLQCMCLMHYLWSDNLASMHWYSVHVCHRYLPKVFPFGNFLCLVHVYVCTLNFNRI